MSNSTVETLTSLRSAIQMTTLRNALNLNNGTINMLIEGVQGVSRAIMENSVTPYKGGNVDISA